MCPPGEVGRAEVVFVVDCSIGVREVEHHAQMDFITTVIGSLPVGQQLVRVGYVPYNTDVLQSFGLGTFDDKNDAIVAISKQPRYRSDQFNKSYICACHSN